uniref:Ribose-phosphate pyrophosphokinase N-terminal domain-containing protein n=1 Tax=Salmo trutta TaxID=8032 RepID=A0A674AC57_SALTR
MFCGLATNPEGGAKTHVDKLTDRLVLFSANSSPSCMELANRIAGQGCCPDRNTRFPSQIDMDVNRCLMEFCVMAYGCVTACARSVCGVLPFLPYSKQWKMRKRGSVVWKLIASLMCRADNRSSTLCSVGDNGFLHCVRLEITGHLHCVRLEITGHLHCVRLEITGHLHCVRLEITGHLHCVRLEITGHLHCVRLEITGHLHCVRLEITGHLHCVRLEITWSIYTVLGWR